MTETATEEMNSKVLGIVAEYNPLHYGHVYQMKTCREACGADYTMVIMSGDFTQRGEPALIDKWSRTRTALAAGADLVVELPFYYACNGAGYFAHGAIKILEATGVVTHLGFGSESGNIDELNEAAEIISEENGEISEKIREYLSCGLSYPSARAKAVGQYAKVSCEANNILALEYISAIKKLKSSIKPVTVLRKGAGYNDDSLTSENISAKAVRKAFSVNENKTIEKMLKTIPEFTAAALERDKEYLVIDGNDRYFNILRSAILRSEPEELKDIFSISEGMENKMKNEIRYASDTEDFIKRLKSKRYTRTRIQRMCAHTVTGFKKNAAAPEYIRVLGFTTKGAKLIKMIKENDRLSMPVITNINREKAEGIDTDIKASDIYNLICGKDLYRYSDYVKMLEIFG